VSFRQRKFLRKSESNMAFRVDISKKAGSELAR
jgi:hypothetical protein